LGSDLIGVVSPSKTFSIDPSKGYTQRYGVSYQVTFALDEKIHTIYILKPKVANIYSNLMLTLNSSIKTYRNSVYGLTLGVVWKRNLLVVKKVDLLRLGLGDSFQE